MYAGAEVVKMATPPIASELIMVAKGRSRHSYVLMRYVANSEDGLVVNAGDGVRLQHPCAPRPDSGDVAQQPVDRRYEARGDEHRQAGPVLREEDVCRFGQSDLVRRQQLRLEHAAEDVLEHFGVTLRFDVHSGDGRLGLRSRMARPTLPRRRAGRP
jgi:hypothetical protein